MPPGLKAWAGMDWYNVVCSTFIQSKQITKPAQIQDGEKQTPPLGRWSSRHLKGWKELLEAIFADSPLCYVSVVLLILL